MSIYEVISEQMQRGKSKVVIELVQMALDEGEDANRILNDGLMAAMQIVGVKFKNNEVFVPEVLIAARAMSAGVGVLKPYLSEEGAKERGTVVIGTIKGDLHDIGKNLVKMMMESRGLTVVDLGSDVAPEQYVAAAKEHNADIIACSALLTTTMNGMKDVVQLVREEKLSVKIMVGGAPVTQAFCDQIGADCYTPDATSAAEQAVALVRGA